MSGSEIREKGCGKISLRYGPVRDGTRAANPDRADVSSYCLGRPRPPQRLGTWLSRLAALPWAAHPADGSGDVDRISPPAPGLERGSFCPRRYDRDLAIRGMATAARRAGPLALLPPPGPGRTWRDHGQDRAGRLGRRRASGSGAYLLWSFAADDRPGHGSTAPPPLGLAGLACRALPIPPGWSRERVSGGSGLPGLSHLSGCVVAAISRPGSAADAPSARRRSGDHRPGALRRVVSAARTLPAVGGPAVFPASLAIGLGNWQRAPRTPTYRGCGPFSRGDGPVWGSGV